MSVQSFPALQADDGFVITLSDTDGALDDPNNTHGYKWYFVHNKGVGATVTVKTIRGTELAIYINQGQTSEMGVTQVLSTGTTAAQGDLIAFVGRS